MIERSSIDALRARYGHAASWAVWAPATSRPKSNIADLTVLDPDQNRQLTQILHTNTVLLGLNISRRIERPFGNFHDPRPSATDYRLRAALSGSPCWGAYMTDVIKDFEQRCSRNVMRYLRENPSFEQEQIEALREELRMLGPRRPTLIALGRDAEAILRRGLEPDFNVIGVPHYANFTPIATYRTTILERLRAAGVG